MTDPDGAPSDDYCGDCELRPAVVFYEEDELGFGGPLCEVCDTCVHDVRLGLDCPACLTEHAVYGDEGAPRDVLDLAKHLG